MAARPVLLSLASFAFALSLYTRHAEMPFWWHSDEPSKVGQVTGERALNFKHPLLLLGSTRALARAAGADQSRQDAARAGRFVSATFAALAVATLVALAWLQRGPLAAACAAPILALSHALLTFSHFLKEDTALAFGVAAALFAGSFFLRRPSARAAAAFGVGCALAASGKYVGALLLAGALPLLLSRLRAGPSPGLVRGLAAFAAGLAATLALVNLPVLLDPGAFRAGLAYETDHAATGGGRPFAGLFSAAYGFGLRTQIPAPVALLAAGWTAYVLATWGARTLDERAVALFGPLYLAALQLSPIKAIRYLLPVVVVAHLLAAFAIATLAERAAPRRRTLAAAALLALVVVPQALRVRDHLGEFAGDSRYALAAWARAHVPAESAILQDRYAGLPDPARGYTAPDHAALAAWVVTRHYAVDYGSVDELRAKGVEYVAVCDRAYGRFASGDRRFGSEEARATFERRRARYEELFARGELVFEAGGTRVAGVSVNPVVRVYRLPR